MTSRTQRIRARIGDVFLVPASSEGERAYGQVIAEPFARTLLVVIFRSEAGPLDGILASGIQLAGIIFDAKLRNGDWPIISNRAPIEFTSPWFVSGHEELAGVKLSNLDGSITRPATPAEASTHGHMNFSSPMLLQWAVEAVRGHRQWIPELDIFRALGLELARGSHERPSAR